MTPIEKKLSSKGNSYPHSARVAIVGGGIGGMALALSLYDAGFRDVDVKLLADVPTSEPFVAPNQATLEQILAQIQVVTA